MPLWFRAIICKARGRRKGKGLLGESEAGPPQPGFSPDPGPVLTCGVTPWRLTPLLGDSNLVQAKRPPQGSGPLTTGGPTEATIHPFIGWTQLILRETVPPTGVQGWTKLVWPWKQGWQEPTAETEGRGCGSGFSGCTKSLLYCVRAPVSNMLDFFWGVLHWGGSVNFQQRGLRQPLC